MKLAHSPLATRGQWRAADWRFAALLAAMTIAPGGLAHAADATEPAPKAQEPAPAPTLCDGQPSISGSVPVLGDWKKALCERGFNLQVNFIDEVFGNPTGGVKQGARYEQRLELGLDGDMEADRRDQGPDLPHQFLRHRGAEPLDLQSLQLFRDHFHRRASGVAAVRSLGRIQVRRTTSSRSASASSPPTATSSSANSASCTSTRPMAGRIFSPTIFQAAPTPIPSRRRACASRSMRATS